MPHGEISIVSKPNRVCYQSRFPKFIMVQCHYVRTSATCYHTVTIGFAVRADFRRLYPANAKTPTCCPSDDNRTKVTNPVTSARTLWWHVGPYFWPADLTLTANPIAPRWKHLWHQPGITGGTLAWFGPYLICGFAHGWRTLLGVLLSASVSAAVNSFSGLFSVWLILFAC